jgi:NitT/TauT family transport system permease protein
MAPVTRAALDAPPAVQPSVAAAEERAAESRLPPVPARARSAGRSRRLLAGLVHAVWPIALVLAGWAAWVQLGDLPPAVAPAPADVLTFIVQQPGGFVRDALDTVLVVAGGLALGTVGGALLAALSWFSPLARSVISGPALITQCLPVATISPVLARVFGYNTSTIVIITALIAFFPVLVFTTAGLRQTPPGSDDLFVVFGASRWQRFWRLAAPAAVPRLLVALRLSVVAAVVGAMLAQWIMGTSGLGYRLVVAQAAFRTSEAWAASLVAIVLSVVLYSLVAVLCRRAQRRFE